MVELADALDSKSSDGDIVRVRFPPSAPNARFGKEKEDSILLFSLFTDLLKDETMTATNDANKFLGTEKINKLMLRYSFPCIMSMLIAALYNMVDQIFIGQGIGMLGNGATSVVYPITVIALAITLLIGNGNATFFSISQGKKEFEASRKSVGNAIVLILVASVSLTLLFIIFKEQILSLFGATQDNYSYASEYFDFIIIGIPFFMIDNMLNSTIRADGSPKFAMFATLTGCIINIILDPIAIFVLGLGMKGAAIATVIGQFVSAILAFTYLFRTKSFKLDKKSFRVEGRIVKKILSLGLSSLFTQLSVVFLMAVMNNALRTYGAQSVYGSDIPIAVIGIIMKVFMLVTSMAVGFSVGLQPIVGYNRGAGNKERVKEIFRKMLFVEACIGLVALFVFEVFPVQIVSIFGSGDLLYNEFASLAMRIHLGGVTLFCLQRGCAIFMQSLGKPMLSAFTTFLRELMLNIPLIIILAGIFGVTGVLFAAPIADVIAFSVTFIIAIKVVKSFMKNAKE